MQGFPQPFACKPKDWGCANIGAHKDMEVSVTKMKMDDDSTSYKIWPFQSAEVSVNGDRNNGGINLIGSPELIELIHEATEENGLRELLLSMNAPNRAFMTLGCLTGETNGAYYSYVEFTPRDQKLTRNEDLITGIHRLWLEWTNKACAAHLGLVAELLGSNALGDLPFRPLVDYPGESLDCHKSSFYVSAAYAALTPRLGDLFSRHSAHPFLHVALESFGVEFGPFWAA